MPKKPEPIDWNTYISTTHEQQEMEKAVQDMRALTGRGLYEMPSYSLCAKYLIDRPSNHAMHGTITNYPLDPVETVQDILIDGEVYYKVIDYKSITRDKYIRKVNLDYFTGQIQYILIGYAYGDKGNLFYWESYTADINGGATYTIYKSTTKDDDETIRHLTVDTITTVPFLPYVHSHWKGGQSFLESVKETVIRIEAGHRVIGVENTERRGSGIYLTGVSSVAKIRKAPKQYGRSVYMLEEGAEFHNPGSDTAGFELLKWEIVQLWNSLEKATNVVSTEKLANLSGISRTIAEKPLIFLCEDLRTIYQKLLYDIYALVQPVQSGTPEPRIKYRRLVEIEDKSAYLALLDKGKEEGAITQVEYNEGLRLLLDLA